MKEEMKSKMSEAFDLIVSNLGEAKGLVKEHAPDIAKEQLSFGMASNLFSIAIFSAFLAVGVYWFNIQEEWGWIKGGLAIACFGFAFGIAYSIETILKIWLAPKTYIIEQAKELLLPEKESD